MIKWIKNKLGITALEEENKLLREKIKKQGAYVHEKIEDLKDYTRVDADVGFRGNNTVVLTGVYRNYGYVRFYDMGDGQFRELVEFVNSRRDHALIRNIDAPPNFRGVFDI